MSVDLWFPWALALTGWAGFGYYATRLVVERYELKRIEADIDSNEKLRDYYQNMEDGGKALHPEEKRRFRITKGVLDDLYGERKDTKDLIKELER